MRIFLRSRSSRTSWHGFTLVELLVVIAIIAILVLMLLPAINAARETARRNVCMGNLSQIGVALSSYHLSHETYPPGTVAEEGPVPNRRAGYHHSWVVQILPYLDEHATYKHIDKSKSVYHEDNVPVSKVVNVSVLRCPSYSGEYRNDAGEVMTEYAACHHDVEAPIDADNQGVMFLNSAVRQRDVTDGLAKTILVGEKISDELRDQSWLSGTRGTLRNTGAAINTTSDNAPGVWRPLPPSLDDDPWGDYSTPDVADDPQPEHSADASDDDATDDDAPDAEPQRNPPLAVGGFGSEHFQGALFVFGDGHVRFLPEAIDLPVYQQLGHRADGKLLGTLDSL